MVADVCRLSRVVGRDGGWNLDELRLLGGPGEGAVKARKAVSVVQDCHELRERGRRGLRQGCRSVCG